MTGRRRLGPLLAIGASALVVTSCSTTSADTEPTPAATVADTPAPTVVDGTTAELLAAMTATMSGLGSAIADGDGDDAALAEITATWAAARPDVQADRPELVAGIDTTVEMATRAVDRTRPADADKAFKLLSDLVDEYTGDG